MTDQPDLFSTLPGKVRRDHPPTSRAAALSVTPRTGTQRRKVLDLIARRSETAARGATDEEIQFVLAMSGNTERPRRVELVEGGWVRDSGLRRPSASGGESIVWELVREVEAA